MVLPEQDVLCFSQKYETYHDYDLKSITNHGGILTDLFQHITGETTCSHYKSVRTTIYCYKMLQYFWCTQCCRESIQRSLRRGMLMTNNDSTRSGKQLDAVPKKSLSLLQLVEKHIAVKWVLKNIWEKRWVVILVKAAARLAALEVHGLKWQTKTNMCSSNSKDDLLLSQMGETWVSPISVILIGDLSQMFNSKDKRINMCYKTWRNLPPERQQYLYIYWYTLIIYNTWIHVDLYHRPSCLKANKMNWGSLLSIFDI